MTMHLLQRLQVPIAINGSYASVERVDMAKLELYLEDSVIDERFILVAEKQSGRHIMEKFDDLGFAMTRMNNLFRQRAKVIGEQPWFDRQVKSAWSGAMRNSPQNTKIADTPEFEEFMRLLSGNL